MNRIYSIFRSSDRGVGMMHPFFVNGIVYASRHICEQESTSCLTENLLLKTKLP